MKTMRFAIFAVALAGADALSVRGNPSLLQAKLPLPQDSATKEAGKMKTLEDMEATLMRMAKSGYVGTPLKDFADLIAPQLTAMEGAINTSHTTDQNTMDSYGAAFTTCTTAKTAADSNASALLATKGTQSTAHKSCRTSEGMAQTNYTNCVTAMNSLETSKTTACNAYTLANKVPNINLVPQPGMGASYRSWLVSVRDWVLNELATLDAANESCVNSTGLYNNKKWECEGANGQGGLWLVHNNLKTQCDANQTALEGTTCLYAADFESACNEYSTCHANANSSYDAGKANLLSAQSNRILEYLLVKRLMCFCNLFSAADGADLASADIDTCKNTNHSTLHLQLALPTVPAAPGTCQAVDQRPCSSSYTSTEYGSLPSNAPAAACQVCPWATTTTTTTTTTTLGICFTYLNVDYPCEYQCKVDYQYKFSFTSVADCEPGGAQYGYNNFKSATQGYCNVPFEYPATRRVMHANPYYCAWNCKTRRINYSVGGGWCKCIPDTAVCSTDDFIYQNYPGWQFLEVEGTITK